MKTWQTETAVYLVRLDSVLSQVKLPPPHPASIPRPPLGTLPSPLQSVIQRAVAFYEVGIWCRTKETVEAIITLWREGYLSPGAPLARLLLEMWGASRCMTNTLDAFAKHKEIARLSQTVDRLFEGVRSHVLLPWGGPASARPIHVLDVIRALGETFPEAMAVYEDLCESAHANLPRFFEWWVLGKAGDNWTNESMQTRGHALINKTVEAVEHAVWGVKTETEIGIGLCGELYGKPLA